MGPSRADRILADWDRISRRVSAPGIPAPATRTSAVPGATIVVGIALVLAAATAGLWIGRSTGGAQVGAGSSGSERSPSPSHGPSTPGAWGPLAVIPPQDGMDTALNEGRVRITATCVHLERGDELELLYWPANRTKWNAESRTITFRNFDGTDVTFGDGDEVVLGGGGDSAAESGLSADEWVQRIEWVAPPAPSCVTDTRWGVGSVDG